MKVNLQAGIQDRKNRSLGIAAGVIVAMLVVFSSILAGISSAAPESFTFGPSTPVSEEAFFLNITTNGSCLTMYSITNLTGDVIYGDIININSNVTQIGPFEMPEGNYTITASFWYLTVNASAPVSYTDVLTVAPTEETAEEEISAVYLIIIGISVVFAVLSVLALITYVAGRILPAEKKPVAVSPAAANENEKIAAIAAFVRTRRD